MLQLALNAAPGSDPTVRGFIGTRPRSWLRAVRELSSKPWQRIEMSTVLLPAEGLCWQVTRVIGYDGQPGISQLTDGLVHQVDLTKVLAGPLVDWTLSIEVRVLCDVGRTDLCSIGRSGR